jgi:pyridoxal phosphate enzyme (YggS family)
VTPDTPDIDANLASIRQRISIAAEAAGRQPNDIRLIAVTKYMPSAYVETAMALGQHSFGENTLQGAMLKQSLLDDPSNEWHFIGHLQTNKAKKVPAHFKWLHTLDSLKLARKLSESALQANTMLNVLLQVNIASDPDKYGLLAETVHAFTEDLLAAELAGIRLCGLMTIGRRDAGPEQTRASFAALREMAVSCADRFGNDQFRELSMGMSNDFEIAIAEGATMVRVGSEIFGPRPDSNAPSLK